MPTKYNFENLFAPSSTIKTDFEKIWSIITEKVDDIKTTVERAKNEVKDLILYDALDGSRSTLATKHFIEKKDEMPLFSIELNHTLKALGVKSCVTMIHTSYNRERGDEEFKRVLYSIKSGAELIIQHSVENGVRCNCLCLNNDYELYDLLRNSEEQTKKGIFNAYYLFDYNEEWYGTKKGKNILNMLPEINVHVRHTKFNFSGGWIPGKMEKSTFLYSQNGSTYSNWESDEIVVLVALALLAKKFNEGEGLNKVYCGDEEVKNRYIKRERELFQKTIYLRDEPRKLFICGAPFGVYQFYY